MIIMVPIILLLFTLVSAGRNGQEMFKQYMDEYNKFYEPEEIPIRYEIFMKNLDFISNHNAQDHSYKLGITLFTDMTNDEFRNYVKRGFHQNTYTVCQNITYSNQSYATSVDWKKAGAVTYVKDQDMCGSCWAFSTTGAMEGLVAIKTGRLTGLSEQQLLDCSSGFGNQNCGGGLPTAAFEYIISNGGLCSEDAYPYTSFFVWDYEACESGNCTSVKGTDISMCYTIQPNNERALGYYVSQQPISIGIQASSQSFQHYKSGIYNDPNCYTGSIDHAVLITGFDDTGAIPYYMVKNSWGNWGNSGYIFIERNPNGTGVGICGLTLLSSFPVY